MSVKIPYTLNGRYISDKTEQQIEFIDSIRSATSIDSLKNIIYDFPLEMLDEAVEKNCGILQLCNSKGIDPEQYRGKLRPYQTVGTAFMFASPRSMIADGVGLGKTAEISGLINYLKRTNQMGRFLIAVESSAFNQTAYELMRFTGLNVAMLPSYSNKLKRYLENTDFSKVDGIIIKHSVLRNDLFYKWVSLNIKDDNTCRIFDTFFLDESSVIKNTQTQTYQYTQHLCSLCKRVHFMNATSFETNIMDIYNQMDLIDPNLLPKKSQFNSRYSCYARKEFWKKNESGVAVKKFAWDRVGYKNQAEFKKALELNYFGRCKKDIGIDIEHVYKIYTVQPTDKQLEAIRRGNRYPEVLNCPSLLPDTGIAMDRKSVPKLDRLINLVETEFYSEKVMVYCFNIEAQEYIARELREIGRKPVILNGATKDRWEIQQGFNSGAYDVIITNIVRSLNLYGGDTCIFYSHQGNIGRMEQIRGRIDRNVDDKIKTFVLLLYENTDEYAHFMEITKNRAKDARALTINAKTAVDFFVEAMEQQEQEKG